MKVTLDDVKLQVNLNLKYAKLQYKKDRDVANSCYRASQAIMVVTEEQGGKEIRKILDDHDVTQYVNNPTMKMLEDITPEEDEDGKE